MSLSSYDYKSDEIFIIKQYKRAVQYRAAWTLFTEGLVPPDPVESMDLSGIPVAANVKYCLNKHTEYLYDALEGSLTYDQSRLAVYRYNVFTSRAYELGTEEIFKKEKELAQEEADEARNAEITKQVQDFYEQKTENAETRFRNSARELGLNEAQINRALPVLRDLEMTLD